MKIPTIYLKSTAKKSLSRQALKKGYHHLMYLHTQFCVLSVRHLRTVYSITYLIIHPDIGDKFSNNLLEIERNAANNNGS